MAIVNKFNVNREQVTLDADIIENMSANDVSYDDSFQYDENTVGNKLSELESELESIIGNFKENYSTNYQNKIIVDDGYCVSDYIPCPNGTFQVYYSDGIALGGKYICFVNDSDNLISIQNQNVTKGVSITPPDGSTKFRFTFVKGFAAYASYNGTHIYDAVGISEKLDEKISVFADMAKNNTIAIEQLTTRTEDLGKMKVKILGNHIINKSLDNTNSVVDDDGYCVSDYIPCPNGTFQVYYSDSVVLGTKYLCFVNDNETFISETKLTSASGMSITPPNGSTKFRFTFVKGFAAYAAYMGIRIYESEDMDDILGERFKDTENDIQDLDAKITTNQDNITNIKSPYRMDYHYRWPYIKEIYISPDCTLGWSKYYLRTIWNNNNGQYRIVLSSDLNNTQFLTVSFTEKPANAPINVKDSGIYVFIDWDLAPINVSFSYEIIKDIALDARQNPLSFADYIRNNSYLGSKDEQIVTLISDDLSNERTAARLADICDGMGIKCTFALIPNYDENGLNPSISESKKALCYDFIQRGHSIAMHPNHTLFYGANGTQQGTPTECEKCLAQTRMMFKKECILDGDNFLVWPGSSGSRSGVDDLHPMAERQVKLAVHSGYWNQTFLNNRDNFNRYMVRRLPVLAGDNTITEFKDLVDEFVESGKGWLVLMTHDHWLLEDNESKTQSYQNYFSEIVEILQYILDKGIPFKTLTEAYNNKVTEEYLPSISLMKK